MNEDTDEKFEQILALFMQPRPAFAGGVGAAVILGGKPKLPDRFSWPDELTFYAQIDLSLIQRSLDFEGQTYDLDELPPSGNLFIFLPLFNDGVYDGKASVLYCEEDVSGLPERDPPDNLGDLRADAENWHTFWIDAVGLSECGRLLYRQYVDLLPVLTPWPLDCYYESRDVYDNDPVYKAQKVKADALAARSKAHARKRRQFTEPAKSSDAANRGLWAAIRETFKPTAIQDPEPAAIQDTAAAYWDTKLYQAISEETEVPRFETGYGEAQILGAPLCVQDQAAEIASFKTLLLQIEARADMQVQPVSGNFQLWIKPRDLVRQDFSKVEFTYFFT